MNRAFVKWSSFAVWGLSGVFLIAAAVFYYRLDRDVTRLKQERATLIEQMDTISRDRDSLATSLILLRNSAQEYSYHVATLGRVLDGHCDDSYRQRCGRWLKYGKLLNYHQKTMIMRLNAKKPSAFVALVPQYARYRDYIQAIDWHRPIDDLAWRANANEGMGYALWKAGHAKQAYRFIDQAIRQNGRSGVIGLTYLKISCANEIPAAIVRQRYAQIRRALMDSSAAAAKTDAAFVANTTFNLEIFDSDAELAKTCSYADLTAG